MPGKVAVKSLGQDGRAELYKPNKEHDRQGQASSNKLATGMGPIAVSTHTQSSQQAQGPTNRDPTI